MGTQVEGVNMAASVHMALQRQTLIPAYHLRKASRALHQTGLSGTPTVKLLFVGESNMTPMPTYTFSQMDSAEGQILRAFERANPFCKIDKSNFAYGGATFTSLNMASLQTMIDSGYTLGSWATGYLGLTLYERAAVYDPDIILIMCGTNDQENYSPPQRRAVEAGFLAECPDANLIWVTGPQWSQDADDANAIDPVTQIGTTATAHHIASNAVYTRRGLIDFHRMHMALVQGVDVHRTRLGNGNPASESKTTPFVMQNATDLDFDLQLTIPTTAATWSNRKLRVSISYAGVNGTSFFELVKNGAYFDVIFSDIDDGPGRVITATTIPVPVSGDTVIQLSLRDDQAQAFVNGTQAFRDLVKRMGGTFAPRVSFVATSGIPSLVQTMAVVYRRSTYLELLTGLSNVQALGSPTEPSIEQGGNAINHWSSRGLAEIIGPTLDLLDFRIPVLSEGNTEFPGTDKRYAGIGTAEPQAFLHIEKTEVDGYAPSGNANHLLLTDPTSAGMSLGTSDVGSARINMGHDASPSDGGLTYTASSGYLMARACSKDVMRFLDPLVSGYMGFQVLINRSGTIAITQVRADAPTGGKRFLFVDE